MNEEIIELKGRIRVLKHNIILMKGQIKTHESRIKDIKKLNKNIKSKKGFGRPYGY